MAESLLALYFPVYAVVAALLLALEWLSPLQRRGHALEHRWLANISLYFLAYWSSLLLFPLGVIAFVQGFPERGLGSAVLPAGVGIGLTILLLDLWRYWEHRLFHRIPLLWHLHLVHHSDTQMDVTTTERHHPLEALLSLLSLLVFVLLFAPPAEGVVAYALLGGVVSLLSHANIDLPPRIERVLGTVMVTPGLHAIHHSDRQPETDSNYGTVLIVWDRLFRSLSVPDPERPVRFGLEYFHQLADQALWRVLLQPFIYHEEMAYTRREESAVPHRLEHGSNWAWKTAVFVLLASSLILLIGFSGTVSSLTDQWRRVAEWQYAWLVVPVFLYLVFGEYRRDLARFSPEPGWWGLLLAVPGVVIMLAGALLDINFARQVALVILLQALILSTLGVSLYRRFLPLWCLLFLAVPYSDIVLPPLRLATLWSIETFAGIAGLPFESHGFSLTVGGRDYAVLPACAGMTYFTLAVFLSYSLALVLYRRFLPIILVTFVAGGLAIVANFARVNAIVVMDILNDTQAGLEGHRVHYWFALALMMALLVFLLTRLSVKPVAPGKQTIRASGRGTWRWRPVGPVLVICLIPAFASGGPQLASSGQAEFDPPEVLGGYRRVGGETHWLTREDGGSRFRRASYSDGVNEIAALVEVPLAGGLKLDSWRVVPDAERQWNRSRRDHRLSCAGDRCDAYLHHVWRRSGGEEVYNVYASYVVNGRETTSQFRLRWEGALQRLSDGAARPAAILAVVSDEPINDPAVVTMFLDQLNGALTFSD